MDDAALIDAIQRGDPGPAAEFYDRVAAVVDRTLFRIFGRREPDHEDLMQTVLEQIVLTLAERRYAGACSLPTWASAIASHVGLTALRSRRRERLVFDRENDASSAPSRGDAGGFERELGAREELQRVREHLAAMDPAKASVLLLHDVLGHELSEIAVLTNASVAAVQSRLVRGRKDLMERLELAGRERPSTGGRS
jgi:RNA polymerase sigma-70 factor (ECF subfamily)